MLKIGAISMIKINIEVVKDNGDIERTNLNSEDNLGYAVMLLEVAEVFARNEVGGVNDKVETFRRILKKAAEVAEDCDTENLKDLIGQDYTEEQRTSGRGFDKCYDTW